VRRAVLLFSATLFSSAALLFCVEPMIARMLLPLLGGAPAVWVTCMLFFQVVLLLGYGYAHIVCLPRFERVNPALHSALLVLPLFLLPIAFDARTTGGWPPDANPTLRVLGLLAARAGLPFFALSASGPLLQKWFSTLGHPSGKDPYFLYVASNLGSMLALLAYPLVLEPTLGLVEQGRVWELGYFGLLLLVFACVVTVVLHLRRAPPSETIATAPASDGTEDREVSRPGIWILLAFIPSSLMLGVTTYVTTDIAPVPLFWVMPLVLYLLSFILVFAKRPVSPTRFSRALPFAVSLVLLVTVSGLKRPGWLLVLVHLGTFFVAAVVCHGALARMRPPARRLTEFYFCMSVGGALGGVMNALVAPAVFSSLYEYPLVLVLACVARGASGETPEPRDSSSADTRLDLLVPLGIGALTAALVALLQHFGTVAGGPAVALMFGPSLLVNYSTLHRPLRFALGVLSIFLASGLYTGDTGRVLHSERSFFGVVAVSRDPTGRFNQIVHGDTIHGRQNIDPSKRSDPLVYYARTGPVGDILAAYNASPASPYVGVIGLGAGSMAAYARPGQKWTFYEIDPVVARIATNPEYFTFLRDAFPDPGDLEIKLGDGRVELQKAPDAGYGLLVLDAFSSDAIPMHLVTEQSLALFLRKIAARGLLALHLSNRYLNLYPVFGDLARSAHLVAFARRDGRVSPEEEAFGKVASEWMVMARDEGSLGALALDPRWVRITGREGRRLWTDDYSNLLGVFRW
jgi:hypothetical protein